MELDKIYCGDALETLETFSDECIDCVVTSPPYFFMRSYLPDDHPDKGKEVGNEASFQEYLERLLDVFDEARRVLKKSGTCFVNLGDTYGTGSGKDKNRIFSKQGTIKDWLDGRPEIPSYNKCLLMLPERFAIAMSDRGWKIRNKIIWHKKNPMPSSVTDRLSNKYEIVYFFTKSLKYHFDLDSIRVPYETHEKRPMGIIREREYGYNTKQNTKKRQMEEEARMFNKRRPPKEPWEYVRNENGKNPGDVWTLVSQPHPDQHIAMFPEKLIQPMILAGCPVGGTVADPFVGSGTTALVARKHGRHFVGIDLNPEYVKLCEKRLAQQVLL